MLFWDQLFIFAGGIVNLIAVMVHLLNWGMPGLKQEFLRLSLPASRLLRLLNYGLIILLLTFAQISFFHSLELITTSLGQVLLIAFALFWLMRLLGQVLLFGLNKLSSLALVALFFIGTLMYLLPLF